MLGVGMRGRERGFRRHGRGVSCTNMYRLARFWEDKSGLGGDLDLDTM